MLAKTLLLWEADVTAGQSSTNLGEHLFTVFLNEV